MVAAVLCRLLLPLADMLEVLNPLVDIHSALKMFRRQANRLIMQARRRDRIFRDSSSSLGEKQLCQHDPSIDICTPSLSMTHSITFPNPDDRVNSNRVFPTFCLAGSNQNFHFTVHINQRLELRLHVLREAGLQLRLIICSNSSLQNHFHFLVQQAASLRHRPPCLARLRDKRG